MVDVATRKLRYFVAVAEELNFTRAASRLYIAQQSLSKQVAELEEQVGAKLLVRTTRSVALTSAGEAFLAAARAALAALDTGIDAARRAERGEIGTLRVGFITGAALELTEPILTTYRKRHPNVRVELRESPLTDPSCGLREGVVDVALLRTPIDMSQLCCEPLFTEPLMVALRRSHPLAARAAVKVADLLDEPVAVSRTADPVWERFWTFAACREGARAVVVHTASQTEELEFVGAGAAIAITPAAAARLLSFPAVAYVPIDDAPHSTLAVAWHAERASQLVQVFVATALDVRDREPEIVAAIERPPAPSTAARL